MSAAQRLQHGNLTAEEKQAKRRRNNADAARRYRARLREEEEKEGHADQNHQNIEAARLDRGGLSDEEEKEHQAERRRENTEAARRYRARRREQEEEGDVCRRQGAHADTAEDCVAVRLPAGWADNGVPHLFPVSSATQDEVLQRLRSVLGATGFDELVCAVCDTWVLRTCCHTVNVDDRDQIDVMRNLLSTEGDQLSLPLISLYDCSGLFPELRDMLLSKSGVDITGHRLHVCEQCSNSLSKRQLPKFAIKNGFYIGSLPVELQEATLPERMMTQLVSVTAVTRVMRGGAHRAIRSHCLTFDATPGPPATLLPTLMRSVDSYRVVMAGSFTTTQQARVRKMHRVQRQVVEDLLRFYRSHNPLYAHVAVDCSQLAENQDPSSMLYEAPDAEVEADDVDVEGSRVGGVSDSDATAAEDELMERRVVFVSDDREIATGTAHAVPDDESMCFAADTTVEQLNETRSTPQFLVRHSSRFSADRDVLFPQMFPHLFPFGRGHPNQKRSVAVSFDACIQHYSMLSSRRFAEDELFMLVAFDHISLQKMYTQVAVRCKRNPALFEPFSDVSEADLAEVLRAKELQRQGQTAPACGDPSALTSAQQLLHSVELSGGAIWGSDVERAQCRRQAFAYQARYGQPALFITLTPNVAESFVMAQYTGVTSVETLFDVDLAGTPSRSAMQSATLKNDVASARLFMHNMDAFVEHVLGVRPRAMRSQPFEGLFGNVEAYYGMVETQGGGTLHAHFLIWLADAPPNTTAFDLAVKTHGDLYLRDLEAYADSIVSTSLPLDIAESQCQFCGEPYASLKALPIPAIAYANPDQRQGGPTAEPLLVQCSGCKTMTSSQHVLRRVLLDHRPPFWPPVLRDYTSEELCTAVARETSSRGSTAAARNGIFRRDCYLSGRSVDVDEEGDRLRLLNRTPQRSERFRDDLFRTDWVARAVQTTPPAVDDARWSPHALAYAVSVLVCVLNLHWWSHVGSCFKKRRSAAPGSCRYGFPKARVPQTMFTGEGVSLSRRLGCEYVNGFSTVMMAVFKSNHDIQFLVGGATALLRIYYATKYVTKMQDMVESLTAVSLTAFRKRQARELLVENTAVDRASVGRRRVASLAFAVTNRREIAGPLAAMYLARGSCCYKSAACAPLPLAEILKQLMDDAAHACNLVAFNQGSVPVYRAASLLDDYCYRPRALGGVCLYGFVMRHFRRKRTPTTRGSSLFQAAHPLNESHCVGTHRVDTVPVVVGVRMPFVDAESPMEIRIKRSRCALVLFKPFRAATNLVDDPTDDAAWVNAYVHWEPLRSSFVCQVMANLDDFYRIEKQAKEAAANADDDDIDVLGDDDVTGTRRDVDAMDDSEVVGAEDPSGDQFLGLSDDDLGDELPIFVTATRSSDDFATSSAAYGSLLASAADTAASAFASINQLECEGQESQTFAYPLARAVCDG